MNKTEQEAMERAQYLLSVAIRFIETNHLHSYRVRYDEATCDGYCLINDCKLARNDAQAALSIYEPIFPAMRELA